MAKKKAKRKRKRPGSQVKALGVAPENKSA